LYGEQHDPKLHIQSIGQVAELESFEDRGESSGVDLPVAAFLILPKAMRWKDEWMRWKEG
jgi:hypothetical protein